MDLSVLGSYYSGDHLLSQVFPSSHRQQIDADSKDIFLRFLRSLHANSYIIGRYSFTSVHWELKATMAIWTNSYAVKDTRCQRYSRHFDKNMFPFPLYWFVFYVGSIFNWLQTQICFLRRWETEINIRQERGDAIFLTPFCGTIVIWKGWINSALSLSDIRLQTKCLDPEIQAN